MCGLSGFVDFKKQSSAENLKLMTDALHHRGPDDSGYQLKTLANASIGLGHRRLSILDLSSHGHQPMAFEHLTLVYNGEVYNFAEVRDKLLAKGYEFFSNSDTEVILKAYHHWGVESVNRFNGMFAFAIHNQKTNKLVLVRDRAGVKPLFWYWHNGLFLFSSELKSFHHHPRFTKVIAQSSLSLFLQYGYVPEPHSIFKNTFKLKAGHWLELDLVSGSQAQGQYWNVLDYYNKPKINISEADAFAETERLLESAFDYRMVADVPVGVFLSGGYDSTAVAAIVQSGRTEKLKTFTIGFNEKNYNEANHAARVARYLGTDHTEYYCEQSDALAILPRLARIWDEPFGDASAIPTVLVSELARKQVTVSLSADGGDEIFAGYSWHRSLQYKRRALARIPALTHDAISRLLRSVVVHRMAGLAGAYNSRDRLGRLSHMLGQDEKQLLAISHSSFLLPEISDLLIFPTEPLQTNFNADVDNDVLSNILALDYKTYMLDDILTKVDRATMSVSLEGREPLLDHRLIEFVATLPNDLKIRNTVQKYLLKKIVHKHVPAAIMDRPKMGFSVPIFEWFREELKEYLMNYLDEHRLREAGFFNVDRVVQLRDRYLGGDQANINKIWYLLVFELWREQWML